MLSPPRGLALVIMPQDGMAVACRFVIMDTGPEGEQGAGAVGPRVGGNTTP